MAKIENKGGGDLGKERPAVQSSVPSAKPPTASDANRGDTTAGSRSGPTELPAQFGRYRVKKKLGGGGMGTVYLVENTDLEREEALKVPHFEGGDDPQLRERFLREAKSAAKLDHPNLCQVHDAGVQDGIYYLTMRFLKGKLLSDYAGKAQPARKVVEIVTKLAQALEAAHAKGVIHRDLKPSNVMMVAGTGPVVMDFGLAKQVKQADQKLTQSGSMLGTPSYMPPEQVKGDLEQMGPASDVYSLGVILYELLTGEVPFQGTMGVIFGQILHVEPPLPSSVAPGLHPALDGICRKAMAKAPVDRFPSMKAFAAALMDHLRTAPVTDSGRKLVPAVVNRAAIFQAPTVLPVPPQAVKAIPVATAWSPPSPPVKPSRLPWLLGGGAVLCAALVGVYFLATIIFRVETKAGTVLLEIDQKDADVYVDGDRITIGRPGGKSTITVEAKEGKHLLRVTKPGFEAWTNDITFRADEANRVKISLKPLAVALNQPTDKSPQKGTGAKGGEKKEGDKLKSPAKGDNPPGNGKKKDDPPALARTLDVALGGGVKLKMALIDAGKFMMGTPKGDANWQEHENQHEVEITQPFYLGVCEVTQAQCDQVLPVGSNREKPPWFSAKGGGSQQVASLDTRDFPAETISWKEAMAFCQKLNEKAEVGWVYDLPTEAEWEYACRGGSKQYQPFHFGLQLTSGDANILGKLNRTTTVGSYQSNNFGLFDMHGNVWEWCKDWYDSKYYANSPTKDPQGPNSGQFRVLRGGSWSGIPANCRSAFRGGSEPGGRSSDRGFRLVLRPPPRTR